MIQAAARAIVKARIDLYYRDFRERLASLFDHSRHVYLDSRSLKCAQRLGHVTLWCEVVEHMSDCGCEICLRSIPDLGRVLEQLEEGRYVQPTGIHSGSFGFVGEGSR